MISSGMILPNGDYLKIQERGIPKKNNQDSMEW